MTSHCTTAVMGAQTRKPSATPCSRVAQRSVRAHEASTVSWVTATTAANTIRAITTHLRGSRSGRLPGYALPGSSIGLLPGGASAR